ncbi:hypothetical protein [uncultured Algibacter sp.]|uniref:hypothetical protein n=1 Tax=uncultured Algibacter sp. TaxID=298659 RepID=UPI0026314491|nr:hypothetical protein [uncultured Algibacter sp.]
MKIRITKSEFDLICEIIDVKNPLFASNQINKSETIISFENIEKAIEFDELIKDKLIYQGFDINYKPNNFGLMCENVIDKMFVILE